MDSIQFCAQESGPDEDHQTINASKFSKAVDSDCETYHWKSEILHVPRNSNIIDTFLSDVTKLASLGGTYGLIWDENLQPSDGRYEPGEHYCGTREPERRSAHGTVAFFRDGKTGVKFAIKTLEENAHFHPEEVKVSLINRHVNICAVYGIIIRDGLIQMLLEHGGFPLNEERVWIAESPQRMLLVAKQSFQALEVLHQSGFVHCDIKPDNIMIARNGNDFTIKLIDFGSCQRLGTTLPRHAHTTLWYWSPEMWQALNKKKHVVCNFAMDVYALALTLYFVQTSFHLMQLLREDDIKDLMTENPEHILLIALPETIPLELRAIMRQCLDACPEARLCAEKAVKQITEDTAIQSENYKEKFERLYSLLKNSSSVSATTVFGENSFQFSGSQLDGVHNFVGAFKGTDKRDVPSTTRNKKYATHHSGNKCNRGLTRTKKVTRQPLKVKPAKKNTGEKSSVCHTSPRIENSDTSDILERNTDERTYSCSILLKNLALQVKPSEAKASEISESPLGPIDTLGHTMTLSLQARENVNFSESPLKIPDIQCQRVPLESPNVTQGDAIGHTIWKSPKQPIIVPDESERLILAKMAANPNQIDEPYLGAGGVNAQKGIFNSKNVPQGIPAATDITIHPTAESVQQNSLTPKASTTPDDDFAFVIEAFEPGAFNGSEDDIVNSWVRMIEQDEQNDTGEQSNESAMDVNLNQLRGENSTREVEFMDVDQTESTLSNRPVSTSDGVVLRTGRKRMSYSFENVEIPSKTICPEPDQKLPNFDQILP
ncbi:hypothetical protein Btru_040459 [Bulinus truncatus]|nr:hypothetical protein Btru_040459 [Bulinus truncatus]